MLSRFEHATRWFTKADEDTHGGPLRFYGTNEVANMSRIRCATFDGYEDPFRSALVVRGNPDHAIDATVTHLFLVRLSIHQHHAPALELERRLRKQCGSTCKILWDTDDIVCRPN
jgi:hypothetical protein